jgi:hypothetical protein
LKSTSSVQLTQKSFSTFWTAVPNRPAGQQDIPALIIAGREHLPEGSVHHGCAVSFLARADLRGGGGWWTTTWESQAITGRAQQLPDDFLHPGRQSHDSYPEIVAKLRSVPSVSQDRGEACHDSVMVGR